MHIIKFFDFLTSVIFLRPKTIVVDFERALMNASNN